MERRNSFSTALFIAKCREYGVSPEGARKARFAEIVRQRCVPPKMDLSFVGVGRECARVVVSQLSSSESEWTTLSMSGNDLGDDGAITVAEFLKQSDSITELDLAGCEIGPRGSTAIFEALESNTTLTSLNLSAVPGGGRNRIGKRGTEAAVSFLRENRIVTKLEMADSSPGPEDLTALLSEVRASHSLTWLDLSATGLSDETLAPFALQAKGPQSDMIEGLVLANNRIGPKGAASLATLLTSCPCLRELDLSGNRLGSVGASHIASALRAHPTLASLKLDSNSIGTAGMSALSDLYPPSGVVQKAVQGKSTVALPGQVLHQQKLIQRPLQVFTVSDNGLDAKAGPDLATFITRSPALRTLDLSDNSLGDAGVSSVAGALASDECSVRTLLVSNNWLSDASAIAIANSLPKNSSLRRIDISRNRLVGNAGCDSISSALDENSTVEAVVVEYTSVGYRSHELLVAKLRRNKETQRRGLAGRISGHVTSLRGDSDWLEDVISRAKAARAEYEARSAQLESLSAELRQAEAAAAHDQSAIEKILSARTELVQQVMASCAALSAELQKVKQEKEASYRTVLQRLHREKEAWRGASKKAVEAERKLSEFQQAAQEQVVKLEQELTAEIVERNAVLDAVRHLRTEIEELSKRPAKVGRPGAETTRKQAKAAPPVFLSRVPAGSRIQSASTASSGRSRAQSATAQRPASSVPIVEMSLKQ